MTPPHRRLRGLGATLAIAGVASLGTVAVAPAATAAPAQTGPSDSAATLVAGGDRAVQSAADAAELRASLLARLGGSTASTATTSVPAPEQAEPCTMSLPATALENVGCFIDPTAPRF